MVTRPAATEQNDGDKRRENGPGKVTTFSVGQGETPGNLLTVIHKARKSYLRCFCRRLLLRLRPATGSKQVVTATGR